MAMMAITTSNSISVKPADLGEGSPKLKLALIPVLAQGAIAQESS
jgi:hypothetical protein